MWDNDGDFMLLYIFSKPENVYQEWTQMETINFGWSWSVEVGSSVVTNVPLGQGMMIVRGAMHL